MFLVISYFRISSLADPMNGMAHVDFLEVVSKYKFAIAMENGLCEDYITEKYWRPLGVGTIPIVLGSPTIQVLAALRSRCDKNVCSLANCSEPAIGLNMGLPMFYVAFRITI